jgi:putative PEP-CTERM system TPR-repeat lipoprotein
MLEPILQVAPRNPALLEVLGQAYAQVGNYAKADQTLAAAARYAELRERATGRQHEQGPRNDQEAALLEQTLGLGSNKRETEIQRAMAAYGRRDFALAEQVLKEALAKRPNDPRLWNLRGAVLMARKDFAAAERDLERALALDPEYVPAAANLAQIDLTERGAHSARRRIEAIYARNPRNVDALLALARLGPQLGVEPREIEQWLRDAIKLAPGLAQARVLLAGHYLERKEPHKALSELKAANAIRGDDPEVLDAMARAHAALGQAHERLTALSSLALLRPDDPQVLQRLAQAQLDNGQNVAAALTLKRVLVLAPAQVEPRVALGQLDLAGGRVDAAANAAAELQQQHPQSAAGFLLEGDVQRYRGNFDAALAAYRTAFRLDRNRDVLLRLQETLAAAGRRPEGTQLLRDWLRQKPQDHVVRKALGNELLLSDRLAEAMPEYVAALQGAPEDAEILNNLAWCAFKLQDKRAVQFAERAYALKSSDPNVLDTYGRILAAENQPQRAREMLEAAVTVAADRQDIRLQLARLHLQAGDEQKARRELERILAAGKAAAEYPEAVALLKKIKP